MHQSPGAPAGRAAIAAAAMPHPARAAAVDEDNYPVRRPGRHAVVTLPAHMDESTAGRIRAAGMISCDRPGLAGALPPRPPAARNGADCAMRSALSISTPILGAKITAPDLPGWAVQRPRITELIAQGTRWFPLTVLTGPAGAGKTMALALWAAARPGPVAWVGLDESDNRPGVFWSYVVAALRRCGVRVPIPAGRDQQADHLVVLRLAAALAAQDPPVMLVLDDLHLLNEPQVLKELDFVLRNARAGLRLAVASRMDPLLPLHRYRLAGQLTEIRAGDLAFTSAEASLLLAQHGCTLPADALECLMRRTEGWAAGLRLAALPMGAHPGPGQFITELARDDTALTGYLVAEVLNTQPPQVREVLLRTSILDQVSADAAAELSGDEQAGQILAALARANAFIWPTGSGWYRCHPLFAEVLRLRLRREHPGQVAALHRRAARWYQRNGLLADAVRHATRAGDWQLAAAMVIDDLAISQILDPGNDLAGEFGEMPPGRDWTGPGPYLISAAASLAAGRDESCAAALDAAGELLQARPAGQEPEGRLAAELIRLAAARRAGDLDTATAAAARAEMLLNKVPAAKLARHPEVSARVLSGRGAVELWSGRLDAAARVLPGGAAAEAPGGQDERADCAGHLALAEALRGRLGRAAILAAQAGADPAAEKQRPPPRHASPAALVALAWVHLERYELRKARSCLRQAEAALAVTPDRLIAAVAYLVAAGGALAGGRAAVAVQILDRARAGWPVPAWLGQQLTIARSRACAAAGDTPAALAAARAGCDDSPEAAVTRAHAWAAAGDHDNARRALAPVLAAGSRAADRVRLHALLIDAQLSDASRDHARGHRSLASALRLAEPEQLRLPFAIERSWLGPALRRHPDLADRHRRLLAPVLDGQPPPVRPGVPDQAPILVVEPLSEREREVLRHVSGMLSTAEVASEMYISANTVKTHLRSIYRKLAASRRGEAVRRARQLGLI
jgi:LuxR family transcriptional regulator, maltose regulon positive regulatory protein